MKKSKLPLLVAVGILGTWAGSGISQAVEPPQPDIAEVKQVIRDAAVKIEKQFGNEHEDARGLAERVEKLLDLKPLAGKNTTTAQKLAKEMKSTSVTTQFGGAEINHGLAGFELNTLAATRRQKVRELTAKQPTIEVLFQLWELTDKLELREESARHRDTLLHACREALKTRPDDADAHAMLADALFTTQADLEGAKNAALESLKRDANHLRARYVIVCLDIVRLFNEAVEIDPWKPTSLDEYIKHLFGRRPFNGSLEKLNSGFEELGLRLDTLEAAAAGSDLALLLRSLAMRRAFVVRLLAAADVNDKSLTSSDQLYARVSIGWPPFFRDMATLRKCLRLAVDHSDAYAAIFLTWANEAPIRRMLSPNKTSPSGERQATATLYQSDSTSGRFKETVTPDFVLSMPEEEKKVFEEVALHLKSLLASAPPGEAAMIHEAFCRMDFHGLYGGRIQFGTRHLLDGVRLDPTRMSLLGFLYPLCQGEFEDNTTSAALFELMLAVDPGKKRRQSAAALINALGVHRRADELLDRCLRDEPEDYILWNQKVVFMLKRDSSEDGVRKAAAIFEKIKEMPTFASAAINNEDRLLFVRNYILFQAMQGRWDEAVSITESYLKEGYMPGKDARALLKTLEDIRSAK